MWKGIHIIYFWHKFITRWWLKPFAVSFLLFAQINTGFALSSTNRYLNLTPKEQDWLLDHPVIRIGVDADYTPYSFKTPEGIYKGVVLDYLSRIELLLGIRFQIVPDLSWPQILESAENRSIDLIATAVQTTERDAFLNFSRVYIPTPLVVVTRDNEIHIKSPSDLAGKRIALVKQYSSSERVEKDYPDIEKYPVDTPLEALTAVSVGNADAYVGVMGVNTHLISKHGITNLKITAGYEMRLNGQRFGVRKDWPVLASILDKALNTITETDNLLILRKWIPVKTVLEAKTGFPGIPLSKEEKEWLNNHNDIRLAIDPDFAPVEFVDHKGKHAGISADYTKLLNSRLGINMEIVPDLTWSQAIELAKEGEIDVFAAITPTVDRKKYLNFTDPYFNYPIVIFTQESYPFIGGLGSLSGEKVAVVRSYLTHEVLAVNYPDIDLHIVNSIREGLESVSVGAVDAFVGDTATSSFAIRKYNFINLKIAAPTDIKSPGLSFAVRKDWTLFTGILDKAFDSIPPEKHLSINKKWIDIEVEQFPQYWIWIAESAAILLIVFVFLSSILRYQVRRRTAEISLKNEELQKEAVFRKKIEEELQLHRDHLEELVDERTNQLKAANNELELFCYSVSHDLRAPLRSINGFCQILIEDYGKSLNSEAIEYLTRMHNSANHMDHLIDDLLILARVSRCELKSDTIDLSTIARESTEMIQQNYPNRKVDCEIKNDLTTKGDIELMRTVIENLFDNAWKYTALTKKAKIEFGAEKKGEQQIFYVRDNGAGFDMKYAEQLFDPFKRLHTTEEYPGTGIGLASVQRIIQRHGGKVWAKSENNKGATFYFSVPGQNNPSHGDL